MILTASICYILQSTIVIPYVLDGKLIFRFGQIPPAASTRRFSADGEDLGRFGGSCFIVVCCRSH